MSGALLALAAVVGIAALFPTYLVIGGQELSTVDGFGSLPAALVVPVANLAVGVVLCAASSRSSAWRTRASPAPSPSASC